MEQPNRKSSIWNAFVRSVHNLAMRAVSEKGNRQLLERPKRWQGMDSTPYLPQFMNNADDIHDELLQSETLWRAYKERLFELEMKQATNGINADPAVIIEVRRITARMEDLNNRYVILVGRNSSAARSSKRGSFHVSVLNALDDMRQQRSCGDIGGGVIGLSIDSVKKHMACHCGLLGNSCLLML